MEWVFWRVWRRERIGEGLEAGLPGLLSSGVEKRSRPRPVTSDILAGFHAPLSNFGRAARQSTSVLICLGLAHAPSFLRAICSIPSFGIAKVAVNVCSPDTNTIPTKIQTHPTSPIG